MSEIKKYQSPKEYRRSLLPIMEERLTGGELAIFKASLERSIKEYDSVSLTKEVREALRWIIRDIGYRYTSPEDEQYIVVRFTSILSKYYGGYSLKDVKQAFEMLTVGGLDTLIKPEDRKHYGQLSMDFLCRVLNAYKVHRSAALNKAYDNAPKQELDKTADNERLEKLNRQRLVEAFIYYKYHGKIQPTNSIQEMLFCRILDGVGLIDDVEEPQAEQLLSQVLSGKVGRYRSKLESAFKDMAEREIQIKEYIKI